MRRFQLVRDVDITGVSGTGTVAQGVEFDDGTVAIRWLGETPSTVMWESIDHAMKVHGHGGATRIAWLDIEPVREDFLDFPTAWRIVKEGIEHTDPKCSYVQTNGALLCDCGAVETEWTRRVAVQKIARIHDVPLDLVEGPKPFRHPIAAHVAELDRRNHPEDYARACTCTNLDTDFHCPIHGGPAEVVKVSES